MIGNLFYEDLVTFNETADDWEEVIRISCNKLLENGYIKESYIDSIFKVVENVGPYFIILDKFALPHANDFGSVLKSGISFVTFKEPVLFSNGKSVQVACTLAAKDSTEHLKMLSELASLLQKEQIVDKFIKIKNKKELEQIMEEKWK